MELLLLTILIFLGFPILLFILKNKVVNWKVMFLIIIIGFVLLLYLSYGMLVQDVSLLDQDE
jgi:hypothetical protein